MTPPPCRLYVLPAAAAPTAVIMRRGPSAWWHLLTWDLEAGELTPGAWLRGMLYPERSAVSPDGKLLGYFALGHGRHPWDTYFAVSKVPWLTALAAWHTHGTWTGGCAFAADNSLTISASMDKRPFHGRYPYGVTVGNLPPTLPGAAGTARDHQGRLLVATDQGEVKIVEERSGARVTIWSRDLNGLTPDPAPSPRWARAW
ncbi:hypothetical protein ACIBO5_57895 [Nonomuraea angiospora]|uniref:hypothetical protein n=1 Tax=Nonomuraea angiospora TaxID=46172 RepID=UPI0029B3DE8C|nr:hypothetical protein [Nonomuraea angiospora]MDX3108138.1 hypothetical protein [Nonomuraea angiospora]